MPTLHHYSDCEHCGADLEAPSFSVRDEAGYEGTTFGPIVDGHVLVRWHRTPAGREVNFVAGERVGELLTGVQLGDVLECSVLRSKGRRP